MSQLSVRIANGELGSIPDTDLLHLFAEAFQTELLHLKDAIPTVESGTTTRRDTPSRVIYGENFDEVNRTLTSMLAVKWLLAHDYETFTSGQSDEGKLTRHSFESLRELLLLHNQPPDGIYALLVALSIDDIGKDPNLVTQRDETLITAIEDHSDALFHAVQQGLVPAMKTVPPNYETAIMKNLEIGSKLNISQVVQAETTPASLIILPSQHDQSQGFNIRAVVTLLDVAGAAGHRDPRGCVVMTERVFQSYMSTIRALDDFRTGVIPTPRACYDQILSSRAEVLHQEGFDLLSTDIRQERALLRLLCMGRVESKELAKEFKQAFELLPVDAKQNLVNRLNIDGIDDGIAVVPYYAPGLISEALKASAVQAGPAACPVLLAFMQFLAAVLDAPKLQTGTSSSLIELDLSFALNTIKSDQFKKDPKVLGEIKFPWTR